MVSALWRRVTVGLLLVAVMLLAGEARAERAFRVACWNVENLFDTIPSPSFSDADFTPQGAYQWDSEKYWRKLGQLSRTIAGMGGASPCALVGLVEVENDSVLYDLTHRTSLARLGYESIVTHGPDVRGVNVALLYQPLLFAPFMHDSLRVKPAKGVRPTRDVLHVAGCLQGGDTLDVFVVHLPSRRGGREADRYRRRVVRALHEYAASLCAERKHPHVIMMGDFNAPATDPVLSILRPEFTLLSRALSGSYYFQHEWSQIDHLLVNTDWYERGRFVPSVYKADYLLRKDGEGLFRSFLGTYYQGGTSDHLPVLLDVEDFGRRNNKE